jgi:integrase/recombinase XerD
MDRIDTIKVPRSLPCPVAAADVAKVLAVIGTRLPRQDIQLDPLRHRMLIETAHVCGARAAEVCGLHVEDLDLRLDDEHVRIHGEDGTVRTVRLDDRGYVALLKLYLARAGYTAGPLFRASINGRGGPLSYDAAHHRWTGYCDAAGAIRRVTERPVDGLPQLVRRARLAVAPRSGIRIPRLGCIALMTFCRQRGPGC